MVTPNIERITHMSGLCARLGALLVFTLLVAPGSAGAQEATGGDVALGLYDCSFSSSMGFQATPGLNISITGPGLYTDAEGQPGTYTYDAGTRILTMVGGAAGGERLIYGSGPNLN